jgi:hypothetical protein
LRTCLSENNADYESGFGVSWQISYELCL